MKVHLWSVWTATGIVPYTAPSDEWAWDRVVEVGFALNGASHFPDHFHDSCFGKGPTWLQNRGIYSVVRPWRKREEDLTRLLSWWSETRGSAEWKYKFEGPPEGWVP